MSCYIIIGLLTQGPCKQLFLMLDDHNVSPVKVLPRKNCCKFVIAAGVAGLEWAGSYR